MTRIYDLTKKCTDRARNGRSVMDNGVLIIDDFYENLDEIYDMLENRFLLLWKYNGKETI